MNHQFNTEKIYKLLNFIYEQHWITTKERLRSDIIQHFNLQSFSRSLFYCDDFAIRFSHTNWNPRSIANTILSLKSLMVFDSELPIFLCIVWKEENVVYMINTTFIHKISHSSKWLTQNNIVWSFLWGDIIQDYNWIANIPENFEILWREHYNVMKSGWNLNRLVENTNNIVWTLKPFSPTYEEETQIYNSINRFFSAKEASVLSDIYCQFEDNINRYYNEILFVAKNVDNVNLRWNIIEYIVINWEETDEWIEIIDSINNWIIDIKVDLQNKHDLWDAEIEVSGYKIAIDVKSKIISENTWSEPKVYNIDKFLEFHSKENTIFLLLFIGIDIDNWNIYTSLRSPFDTELLENQAIQWHWSGRGRRWTVQYSWSAINNVLFREDTYLDIIDYDKAQEYLAELLNLNPDVVIPESPQIKTSLNL